MLNYKLSDNAKFNALWSLLNVNYSEQGGWLIEFDICDIYDEYAVVKNYSEGIWERVYYVKNDETDSLEITNRARCYIMDVSETEKSALDALHGLNNNTYEKVDENYAAAQGAVVAVAEELTALTENYTADKSNFETKIGELNEQIATLTTERDDATSQLTEAQGALNSLNEEVATLKTFKEGVELEQKMAVMDKYAALLSADVISAYNEKLGEYSVKDLDKELAYELVSANQTVFSNGGQTGYIPKDDAPVGGLEGLLAKYSKK